MIREIICKGVSQGSHWKGKHARQRGDLTYKGPEEGKSSPHDLQEDFVARKKNTWGNVGQNKVRIKYHYFLWNTYEEGSNERSLGHGDPAYGQD